MLDPVPDTPLLLTPSDWQRTCEGMVDRSLPFAEWSHAAHLQVGLYAALIGEDLAATTAWLRTEIQGYNGHNGVSQTPTGGYHETVTVAFAHLIWVYAQSRPEARQPTSPGADGGFWGTWLPAVQDLLAGELAEKTALLRYYSRDRINSVEARYGFLPPDLEPLPTV